MKIYFASYATHDAMGFYKNQDSLSEQAKTFGGVDEVIKKRGDDIKEFLDRATEFIKAVEPAKYPRMHTAKYYVWKSYFILESLKKLNDGDILIYHDAGRNCYPYKIQCNLRPFCEYVVKSHKGIFVNFGPFCNRRFTKRECFKVMNCDESYYWDSRQANGSWGIYEKNPLSMKFVQEWFNFCMHPSMIVTDVENDNDLLPNYEAHRHDQSILTNMLLKYSREHALPLDPKLQGKLQKPHGWEKDMCLTISNFEKSGLI
jgi:hypothetical protein